MKEHLVKNPLVATIAAIAIAASSCFIFITPAPLAVVKDDFYGALSPPHGEDDHPGDNSLTVIDVDRAFATFHPDLQEQLNLEEFEIRATEHVGSLARRTVGNWITSVDNDTATVEGCFTGEGAVGDALCRFWLSRENDTWKIVAFRIEDELGSFVGGTIPGSEG